LSCGQTLVTDLEVSKLLGRGRLHQQLKQK
jgi:hypothetical protein